MAIVGNSINHMPILFVRNMLAIPNSIHNTPKEPDTYFYLQPFFFKLIFPDNNKSSLHEKAKGSLFGNYYIPFITSINIP